MEFSLTEEQRAIADLAAGLFREHGSDEHVRRLADSYIEVELLRSALWQLAWRIDQGLPATAAARVAKYQAAQAGHIVGHTSQHFHGGVGANLQYPIHRFYLKSQALTAIGGGAEAQLARIGRELAGAGFYEYQYE